MKSLAIALASALLVAGAHRGLAQDARERVGSGRDVPPAADAHRGDELPSHPDRQRWFSVGAHASLLVDRIDQSSLNLRLGYALSVGGRFRDFGVFGFVEQDLWVETESALAINSGVLNVGVGGEYLYFGRRVRASIALGTSILLADQALDDAPSFGIYAAVRPTGIRWSRGTWWTVQLDPIGIAVVAPVLRSPSIVDVQYRATLAIEWASS